MQSENIEPITFKVGHVIGGAQKCGTSVLHRSLCGVPDLLMSSPKEAHVFDNDGHHQTKQSVSDISRLYGYFFPTSSGGKIPIDATPAYVWRAEAVQRIYDYNPEMKWIICLRNPIARSFSQWKMRVKNKVEERSFFECLMQSDKILKENPIDMRVTPGDRPGLLSRGLYCDQLDRLDRLFGVNNSQIIFTANMRNNLVEAREICTQFIVNNEISHPTKIVLSQPSSSEKMDKRSSDFLAEFYTDEIDRLSTRLNIDLGFWLDNPMAD